MDDERRFASPGAHEKLVDMTELPHRHAGQLPPVLLRSASQPDQVVPHTTLLYDVYAWVASYTALKRNQDRQHVLSAHMIVETSYGDYIPLP